MSTAKQAHRDGEPEGYSLPAQRSVCAVKADTLGAVIVEEYVDAGNSARSADRPRLQDLLDRLRTTRDLDYVIVHKLDRMARNTADELSINLTIEKAGAQLVSCSEQIDSSPSGMLVHTIMAGVAEFYSNNLGFEARKGMSEKAKRGGTPGYCPMGYLNVTRRVDGHEIRTVEVDPERGPHIAWAFEAYATGQYSLADLVDELAARGMVTRPTTTRAAVPLSSSQVHRILSSPYYKGLVVHKGVTYEGKHEALVDDATWDRVQAIRLSRRIAGDRSWKTGHYLMGSLFCARCGQRLGYSRSTGKNGLHYGYFFCLGRNKKRNDCQLPYLPADQVEMLVARNWFNEIFTKVTIADVRARVTEALELHTTEADQIVREQTRRLSKLERTRSKLVDAYLNDAIPVDELKVRQDQLSTELLDAKRQLEAATADVDLLWERLDVVLRLLASCGLLYRECDQQARRVLNQAMYERIMVDVDEVTNVQRTPPFAVVQSIAQTVPEATQAVSHEQTEHKGTKQRSVEYARQKQKTDHVFHDRVSALVILAERVGFEPTVGLHPHLLSREARSTRLRHLSNALSSGIVHITTQAVDGVGGWSRRP